MKIAPSYSMKLGPIELLSRQGGVTARLTCDQCGVHDAWNLVKLPEPGVIKRHFTVRGWDMKKSAKCPQCQENNRKRKVTGIKPTTSEPPKEPSEAAKRAKRLIYQALEDYYDEQKKCYKNGKSDKAVADEVGASEAFVRQIREADFGPLVKPFSPEEIADYYNMMAGSIHELSQALTGLKDSFVVIHDRTETIIRQGFGDPVADKYLARFRKDLGTILEEMPDLRLTPDAAK